MRKEWLDKARAEQLPPGGDWNIWLILAGRGWGKTRTASEYVADEGRNNANLRIALVARNRAEARYVMLEGESGLFAVIPEAEWESKDYTKGVFKLKNGTKFFIYGADEPDSLRGPDWHILWGQDFTHWRKKAWLNARFGIRLGLHPRAVLDATPRKSKLLKKLTKEYLAAPNRFHVTVGDTYANKDNLNPTFLHLIIQLAGARKAQQELFGKNPYDVK